MKIDKSDVEFCYQCNHRVKSVKKIKCDLCHIKINHSGKVHSTIDYILPLNVHIALQTELIF